MVDFILKIWYNNINYIRDGHSPVSFSKGGIVISEFEPIDYDTWKLDDGTTEIKLYTICDHCDLPIYYYESYYSSFYDGWMKVHEDCLVDYMLDLARCEFEFIKRIAPDN